MIPLEPTDVASRRTMLQLMAASFGLAGLTACRRPVEKILPASKAVEDYVPGASVYYATVMTLGGSATGLLVECHDGRPTKIEGNPKHPASRGAAPAFAQAAILSLYDPDRARPTSSWEEFETFARNLQPGERIRFLSGRVLSPSLEAVRAHALERFPNAAWTEYEALSNDQAIEGARLAFGQPLQAHHHFDRADVVVSLDCDFLGLDEQDVTYARDFARRRRVSSPRDSMNRLYVVESQYSVTGAAADHRFRMRVGEVGDFAQELLTAMAGDVPPGTPAAVLARDLRRNPGRALVVVGPRQPARVHALGHALNHALGAFGQTVTFTAVERGLKSSTLGVLTAEMARGEVSTLVMLGGNPAYDAPADVDFAGALKKVPNSIHLTLEPNETSALATWVLPEAHFLEAWGDARALDGTVSIQQPMIQPLFDGRTAAEVVAVISGYRDRRPYDIVHNYWQGKCDWQTSLSDGVVAGTQAPEVKPALKWKPDTQAGAPVPPGSIEIGFYPSASVYDGRFANNGWLQETPDPMTKLTWDNAALISPATAKALGVETGDVISIERRGKELTIAALVQPGHADGAISLALGYGRTRCGRVGRGVGRNAYALRVSNALGSVSGVRVRNTGRKYLLAVTQEHHSMEGRPLVRQATLEQYRKQPQFARNGAGRELFSLYREHSYDQGAQWGMTIDLNACLGCNACVVACQAENNVPIVGKNQVLRGRAMHWIRLDRYYEGGEAAPEVVYQPVACQQCENAPCEAVCPVAATSHSAEGLNDMAYNRCIGTRYCANNCPYKVRRFNFLDYHKGLEEIGKMAFNPNVSVRMRGVMEKCTYCVQRIQEAKIRAKADGRRPVRDGEILTACQQTCPAQAIVFGDLNDPASRVSKLARQDRDYALLGELNTKPRTTYLAKLRNPNPELAS